MPAAAASTGAATTAATENKGVSALRAMSANASKRKFTVGEGRRLKQTDVPYMRLRRQYTTNWATLLLLNTYNAGGTATEKAGVPYTGNTMTLGDNSKEQMSGGFFSLTWRKTVGPRIVWGACNTANYHGNFPNPTTAVGAGGSGYEGFGQAYQESLMFSLWFKYIELKGVTVKFRLATAPTITTTDIFGTTPLPAAASQNYQYGKFILTPYNGSPGKCVYATGVPGPNWKWIENIDANKEFRQWPFLQPGGDNKWHAVPALAGKPMLPTVFVQSGSSALSSEYIKYVRSQKTLCETWNGVTGPLTAVTDLGGFLGGVFWSHPGLNLSGTDVDDLTPYMPEWQVTLDVEYSGCQMHISAPTYGSPESQTAFSVLQQAMEQYKAAAAQLEQAEDEQEATDGTDLDTYLKMTGQESDDDDDEQARAVKLLKLK